MAIKKDKNILDLQEVQATDASEKGSKITGAIQQGIDWLAQKKAEAQQEQKRTTDRVSGKVLTAGNQSTENPKEDEETQPSYTPDATGADYASPAAASEPARVRQSVDSDYDRAMAALREMGKSPPSYGGGYDDQINELYAKITGRGDFQYKLDEDALWQQLKDDYTRMGRQAMQDTMGRAAALTGGYGSSYGQMAGQSAYDQYLTQLMDVAPELAEAAYQRYQDEGTEMRKNLDYLLSRDVDAYSRYNDDYSRYLQERDYLTDRADQLYGRQEENRAYLDALMQMGYEPTDEEIANAGMTPDQYQAIVDYYAKQASGSGSGTAAKEETTPRASLYTAAKKSLKAGESKDKVVSYGSGMPDAYMKPMLSAIRSAENAEEATEIYNKISDATFQQMSKEQLEELDKAMRSRGV